MALSGYMSIPDIPGESQRAEHEGEIDIRDVRWQIEREVASFGRGRVRPRIDAAPLEVSKVYDASSPYLAQATAQGKSFDEVVISVRRDSGDAHLDYLVITMTNALISGYGMDADDLGVIHETVELSYEKITFKYTVQADDHSAGDEHEVEIDVQSAP